MSATTSAPTAADLDQTMERLRKLGDLQISGLECFSELRWREAILYYLFGVWGNQNRVMYRPKIMFGLLTLRLDPDCEDYYAYGHARDDKLPLFDPKNALVVTANQSAVELGLIRFVKNDQIKALCIVFRDLSAMWLWKKERRGQYGAYAAGIPARP